MDDKAFFITRSNLEIGLHYNSSHARARSIKWKSAKMIQLRPHPACHPLSNPTTR
ncbi:hypothetical protein Syun_000116 [Stephania yunnanensis]|uniref:Uncharacterized protein n=1 Tax=Stephania yunnanensis TaxID=152371 RepID=A0AAP0LBJ8_9MAGN